VTNPLISSLSNGMRRSGSSVRKIQIPWCADGRSQRLGMKTLNDCVLGGFAASPELFIVESILAKS
jgi:hypothetical protein